MPHPRPAATPARARSLFVAGLAVGAVAAFLSGFLGALLARQEPHQGATLRGA